MGESSTFLTEILGERYEIVSKLGAGAFFSVRLRAPFTVTRESPR